MSASSKKKLRKEQEAAKMTEKQLACKYRRRSRGIGRYWRDRWDCYVNSRKMGAGVL